MLDLYPYATTSPIYLELTDAATAQRDRGRALFRCLARARVIEAAAARDDYNGARERRRRSITCDGARERYQWAWPRQRTGIGNE